MEERTRSTVPAAPGWFVAMLIEAGSEGGESFFSLKPIVAWEIERCSGPLHPSAGGRPGEHYVEHSVEPITIDGNMNHYRNQWAIKRPDGQFEIPGDCTLENEADAIRHLTEALEYERKERKRKGASA